ncbi:hypothetical protein [Planctomonas deserti]|uniref:hypothetical protein n=1 Tax=Planctomonas deserti TaxID=2144185 RepID=UPI00131F05BD|nr:hypothetical protein [Planctomonas deserti]
MATFPLAAAAVLALTGAAAAAAPEWHVVVTQFDQVEECDSGTYPGHGESTVSFQVFDDADHTSHFRSRGTYTVRDPESGEVLVLTSRREGPVVDRARKVLDDGSVRTIHVQKLRSIFRGPAVPPGTVYVSTLVVEMIEKPNGHTTITELANTSHSRNLAGICDWLDRYAAAG